MPTGASLRKFFDKVTKDVNARWDPYRDSVRFLQALLEYDDPADLLYRLNNQKERGLTLLKQALMQDGSPERMAQYVVPIFRLLGSDTLSGGTCRAPLLALLEALFRVPGLLQCLNGAIAAGKVADASPVGWFLLTLASQVEEVRQSSEVLQLADTLSARGGETEKIARRLKVVLAGTAAAEARAAAAAASGAAASASIKILTTSEEALCARPPYLPRSSRPDHKDGKEAAGPQEDGEVQASDPHAPPDPEAALLDRHFRLLREDLVQPLRQALAVLGFASTSPATASGGQAQQEQEGRRSKLAMSAAAAQRNVFHLVSVMGTALKPRPCVLVAVELPMSHRAARMASKREREEYWREYGKGTLPADALVCIARRVAPGQPPAPLLFGTVMRREPKEMALEARWPVVGLAFERGQAGAERLLAELGRGPVLSGEGLVLVQVSTSFFAIRPVLSCLQSMPGLPLAEELVHGEEPRPLGFLQPGTLEAELAHLSTQGVTLDPSQRAALQACLSQRVALVQGPPGTGKTFVGVLLCDALLRHSSETILVVCYTNHALDQFLEALLEKGITDIVRIGGRSKSEVSWQGLNLWDEMGQFLQDEYPDAWGQLEDGYSGAYRWQQWLSGRWSQEVASALVRGNEVSAEMRALHDDTTRSVLSGARVIGITTTGAAMHKDLLRDADVEPGVVLVEEAGELLEAHVLTSLGPRTKQLIMIGDHKQLRPKVECWPLSVQSGHGHDLNVSLFERLVLSGFPHTALAKQHRMHPDISALVRPTYPALEDAERVHRHPPVLGLPQGRRVVFVDHREPELGDKEKTMWSAAAAHVSKVNEYEVSMVCATVRYLLLQGYRPEQLVVLTPYLGQLLEVQRAMSKDTQVTLDDLDLRDLRNAATPQALADIERAGGKASASTENGRSGVRVATIDNYQGEEADVVVASLVRSNDSGSVGFLREPERINVLLSRARHGMILIGNAATLRNAKSPEARRHWGRVLGALEAAGAVTRGLPVACQSHGTQSLVDTPEAFKERVPDGGCQRPCHAVLPCGHPCMLRCSHAQSDAVCKTCVDIRLIEEEERKKLFKLEHEAELKRREADVKAAQLKARIAGLQRQQAALEEERRARQEAVRLELEGKRLEKELELQASDKRFGAREMQEWEEEQRRQAQAQMDAMAANARLEAQARAEEKAARAEEKQRQELEATAKKLQELEERRGRALQRIANDKQRLEAEADDRRRDAEAKAGDSVHRFRTMSSWKEAVAQVAKEGNAGLASLRQQLRAAASASDSGAVDAAGTLDLVFAERGIGSRLISHAMADAEVVPGEGAAPPADGMQVPSDSNHSAIRRGLGLINDAKWLDAHKYFAALVEPPPPPSSTSGKQPGTGGASAASSAPADAGPVLRAFAALCRAKLGLPQPAQQPRLLVSGKGATAAAKRPSPAAAANSPNNASGTGPHPVEHLAAALAALQPRAAGGSGPSDAYGQRSAAARAVGWALAFLLHPRCGEMPGTLRDEALQLLRDHSPSLSGPALPAAQASGGSGGTGGGGRQVSTAWQERAARSPAFAKLLKLTGLDPVKKAMSDLAAAVELDKERGKRLGSKQYNVRFTGNPGTGKTTVARLYGELLQELGVLPQAEFVETSGSELLTGGVSKLKEQLKKLEAGGVLFLDEAYQLNPKTNPMGAQVLDYLLPEMENRRGKLVVVLAGYKKQMEDLMAHNEGLPSRFVQVFDFPDYTDEELFVIFRDLIAADTDPRFRVADERHLRIAARRLGRQRGATGFGNARAVRNAFEQAQRRQSARVLAERAAGDQPDLLLLVREDLLGPRHLDTSTCSALRELKAMRGLAAVKQSVDDLLGLITTNAELEEQEMPLKAVNLNRVFLGNPGTGKTTVAGIYGRILRDLGLLSKGDVEVRVPSDFVGDVLGASERKTEAILEATKGCVLVIDEAYGLYSEGGRDPFREAVVDTLVARVQGVPGDDRCVLLLGYEEQMEAMMRKANPGLARRFQLKQAWRFEDYGPEDLLAITREAARKRGWELEEAALLAAVEALEAERRKPNFGNAGAVNNLLSAAAMRMEARLREVPAARRAREVPRAEDFLPPRPGGDPAGIFDDLIGCKWVLNGSRDGVLKHVVWVCPSWLREWQATIRACQAVGRDPLQSFELNFRFVGAPGTGKTTVARRVGQLFESLGLLAGSEMVSCSASDFVTGYVNQASGKTRELFKKAVGGVLFIDEAYRLNPKVGGPFMQEALDEIVQLLTEPAFMGKMVVILAGYEHQIEDLMSVNPGLKSRFSQRLHFPDFSAADAAALLRLQLRKEYGLELVAEAEAGLEGLAAELVAAPNWSNGRDVGTWVKRAFTAFSTRNFSPAAAAASPPAATASAGSGDGSSHVLLSDLRAALDQLLQDKNPPAPPPAAQGPSPPSEGPAAGWTTLPPQLKFAHATARAPPPPDMRSATAAPPPRVVIEEVREELAAPPPAADPKDGGGAFGGLDPAFLRAMQDALEARGHDLSSLDAVQSLASDPNLASSLLPYLSVPGVTDANILREMVRQWQAMIAQRMKEERELARRKQRPVWRCAACGRYGCPVAPYIEGYKEI
ncbi:hypothetical protein GPECTOR_10g1014 [Gonium pectorale]|uniref:AAA+ ATPase domain-containing protein n=1 Tax=Gonium pectorale TaxID=33097 RepID=A0A150GQH9_GONPE|nr:hypothetical protein GPECTOR_10g1014 [Gonium pectorale]|eukprot:KXZ51992.1 hypothetical protein GPECTOR_10g1014 [Gonium pectorale]